MKEREGAALDTGVRLRPGVVVLVCHDKPAADPPGGSGQATATVAASRLLQKARAAQVPVLHAVDAALAVPGRSTAGHGPSTAGVGPDDQLLVKTAPSAFFGTPLVAHLAAARTDTLVVVGAETAGGVRATVVDAYSLGFRAVVVPECVYDRSGASHDASLRDIATRYGEVTGIAEILGPDGPTGAGHSHAAGPAEEEHSHHHHHHYRQQAGRHDAHRPEPAAQDEPPLPCAALRSLPPDAEAVAVGHHPIHGHVLARAGEGVLAATREAMAAGFAGRPHVLVELREADLEGGDDERYREAVRMTEGGVIVLGIEYRSGGAVDEAADAATPERTAVPERTAAPGAPPAVPAAGECPECGSTQSDVDSRGARTTVFTCLECGAAWEVANT